MKKLIAILLTLAMVMAFAACGQEKTPETTQGTEPVDTTAATEPVETTEGTEPAATVMTYAEYAAAELETAVVIEAYVQNTQSWWNDQITVYAADQDGAYFIYNMACSAEDYEKLTVGTKILIVLIK